MNAPNSAGPAGFAFKPVIIVIVAATILITVGWMIVERVTRSEAESTCRTALETELGSDGVVKVEDLTEVTNGVLTKVEGTLVYRKDQGAGSRVETWFTCQLEGSSDDLRLRELTIKD